MMLCFGKMRGIGWPPSHSPWVLVGGEEVREAMERTEEEVAAALARVLRTLDGSGPLISSYSILPFPVSACGNTGMRQLTCRVRVF